MPSRLPFRSFQARHPALPPTFDLSPARQTLRFVTELGAFFDEGVRDLGSAFSIDMIGYGPLVVFSDEETVKRITSARPEDFTHANDIVAFFVGQRSIFLLDGEPHKHARRRTLSAFAGDRMRRYGEVMKVAADRYIDTLGPDQTISAMEAGTTMALEIILVALFGMERGPKYDELDAAIRGFMAGGHSPVASLLSYWLPAATMRGLILGDRDPATMARRPMSPLGHLLGKTSAIRAGRRLTELLLEMVQERRATLEQASDDGLSHILRTARDEGHAYDDAAAFDESLTLLLAGHDTTAITLSRALYRLSTAPRVMDALRAELDAEFPDEPLDPARIDSLPYLDAVINECLRLDALARGATRRLLHPMTMGGYDLPAGTMVTGYVYPRQRDAASWEQPDDFYPEQWLGKRVKPHEFAPFGVGFRRCAGAAFATYEMKILLAQFVRRVDFRVPAGYVLKEGMLGPMIAPVGPVPVEVLRVRPDVGRGETVPRGPGSRVTAPV